MRHLYTKSFSGQETMGSVYHLMQDGRKEDLVDLTELFLVKLFFLCLRGESVHHAATYY